MNHSEAPRAVNDDGQPAPPEPSKEATTFALGDQWIGTGLAGQYLSQNSVAIAPANLNPAPHAAPFAA
jgi:hypothetical protein